MPAHTHTHTRRLWGNERCKERENERLRDCIDTLDRQNDELKALLKSGEVVQ